MSDDHGKRKKTRIVQQHEIGHMLHDFLDHAKSHDPDGVHSAFCLIANDTGERDAEGRAEMHICSFMAGDVQQSAELIAQAIDKMSEQTPEFAAAWQNEMSKRAIKQVINMLKGAVEEQKQVAEAKPLADEVIKKMMASPPTDPNLKH